MASLVDVEWILLNRTEEPCQVDWELDAGAVGLAALLKDPLGFETEEEAASYMLREYARQWLDEMRLRE